jgi:hypothetical protein
MMQLQRLSRAKTVLQLHQSFDRISHWSQTASAKVLYYVRSSWPAHHNRHLFYCAGALFVVVTCDSKSAIDLTQHISASWQTDSIRMLLLLLICNAKRGTAR